MEAIRKIVKLDKNTLTIQLPEEYKDKTVELIILRTDEIPRAEEAKIDCEKLYGSLKSGLSIEEIDEQIRQLRNEWDRDIS